MMFDDIPPLMPAHGGGGPPQMIPPPAGATFQAYGGGFDMDDEDDDDAFQSAFAGAAGRRATPYYPGGNRPLPPQGAGMTGTFTGHKPTPMWAPKSPFPNQSMNHNGAFAQGPPQAIPPPFGSQPNTPGLTHGYPTPGSSPGMALYTPPHPMFPGGGGGMSFANPGGQAQWSHPMQSPYAGISSRIVEGAFDGFDDSGPSHPQQQLSVFAPPHANYHSNYAAARSPYGPPPPAPPQGLPPPPPPHLLMQAPAMMRGPSMPPMMQMMGPPPQQFPQQKMARSNSYPGPPKQGFRHEGQPAPMSFVTDDFAVRRPKDWRSNYKPRGSPLGAIASLFSSNDSDFVDDIKRKPSHFLQWSSANPPIHYDLREPPIPELVQLPINGGRPSNPADFVQVACVPSARRMRLWHRKLPWYIDVATDSPNGLTLQHVLHRLFDFLSERISHKHYYNKLLDEADRYALAEAYMKRCQDGAMSGELDPDELRADGILRIDFLGPDHYFEGLVRGSKGLWEIKTGSRQ